MGILIKSKPPLLFRSIYLRIYRRYKGTLLSKIFKKKTNKPSMSYEEIEIIEDLLTYLQPQNCLEWGAGYSTIVFPQFLDKHAKWVAIEHVKQWFDEIKALNKNRNVKVF